MQGHIDYFPTKHLLNANVSTIMELHSGLVGVVIGGSNVL